MSHSKLYNYVIKDLIFFGYHGIDPKEIKNGQAFSITITYSKKINNNTTNFIPPIISYV